MTKYRGPIRAFSASLPTMILRKSLPRLSRPISQFQKMSISTSQILHAQSAKNQSLNVLHTPLALHSLSPVTGFFRNGFCDTDHSDSGVHTIAAIVSPAFLEFTKSRGNNLGLAPGCKWCLCVARWKEALMAYRRGEVGKDAVPRVVLEATHRRTLEGVGLEELQEWQTGRKYGPNGERE